MSRGTILLVDDDPVVLEVGIELLEFLEYETIPAEDGLEALEKFAHHRETIDVVLLDLSMPKMGGRSCLKALLEIDPKVRVVIVSGQDLVGERASLLAEGAMDVMQKPFNVAGMLAKIRRCQMARAKDPPRSPE